MEFSEIVKHLHQSKKIRRHNWPKDIYLKINDNMIKTYHKSIDIFQYDLSIIQSDDWVVVGNEETQISFIDAIKELQLGKKVRLSSWQDSTYLISDNQNLIIFKEEEHNFIPSYQCFISNDWEVMD